MEILGIKKIYICIALCFMRNFNLVSDVCSYKNDKNSHDGLRSKADISSRFNRLKFFYENNTWKSCTQYTVIPASMGHSESKNSMLYHLALLCKYDAPSCQMDLSRFQNNPLVASRHSSLLKALPEC